MSNNVKILVEAENNAQRVLRSVAGDLDDLGRRGISLQSVLGGIARTLGSLAVAGTIALTGAIVGGAGMGLKASIELEQGMANVNAVLQTTTEEAEKLKALSVELGLDPNLKVSTIEAAATMEMLAKNGVEVEDILGGVTKATILLANASGGDFSLAADIATSAMQMFNRDASEMIPIVNGITGALVTSKFGIVDYEYALANAGGMLGALGVPLEDFNQLLSAVAPGFAKGATAGTSLKYMFSNLVPVSQVAADYMKKLGIVSLDTGAAQELLLKNGMQPLEDGTWHLQESLQELFMSMNSDLVPGSKEANKEFSKWLVTSGLMQNKFFDMNGNLKETDDILRVLRSSFGGLNDYDLGISMRKIFGMEAAPAAIRLIRMTEEEWQAVGLAVESTDAEVQAMIRNNTLEAKLEIWGDKLWTLKTLIGDEFSPAFRDLVEGATLALDDAAPAVIQIYSWMADGFEATVPRIIDGLNWVSNLVGEIANQNLTWDMDWLQGNADWSLGDGIHTKLKIGDVIDLSNTSEAFTLTIGDALIAGMDYASGHWGVILKDVFTLTSFSDDVNLSFSNGLTLAWNTARTNIAASLPSVFDFSLVGDAQRWVAELTGVFKAVRLDNFFSFNTDAFTAEVMNKKISLELANGAQYSLDVGAIGSQIQNTAKYIQEVLELSYRIDGWRGVGMTIAGVASTVITDIATNVKSNLANTVGTIFGAAALGVDIADGSRIASVINIVLGAITGATAEFDESKVAILTTASKGIIDLTASLLGLSTEAVKGLDATLVSDAISTALQNALKLASTAINPDVMGPSFASAARGVTDLATAVVSFNAKAIDGVDEKAIATGIGDVLGNAAALLGRTMDGAQLNALGSAVGNLFNTALNKATDFLAAPNLGGDIGEATGSAIGIIAKSVDGFVTGFADELAETDWSKHEAALTQFVTGFIGGMIRGLGNELYEQSIFNPKTRQEAVDKLSTGMTEGTRLPLEITSSGSVDTALYNFLDQHREAVIGPQAEDAIRFNEMFRDSVTIFTAAAAAQSDQTSEEWLTTQLLAGTEAILMPFLKLITSMQPGVGSALVGGMPMMSFGVPTIDFTAQATQVEWPTLLTMEPLPVKAKVEEVDMGAWRQFFWQTGLGGGIQNYVNPFLDNDTPAAPTASVGGTASPEMTLPAWPPFPEFTWPEYPAWVWPTVPEPSWLSDLRVPEPSWLDDLLNWTPGIDPGGNALGTSFWQGGWTWVGESGPELVNLPHGSAVHSNEDSEGMMGGVNVTIHATISSEIDVEQLAYKVSDIVERRRRR